MASLFFGIVAMSYEEEKQTTAEKARKTDPKFQHTLKELREEDEAAEVWCFLMLLRITEFELSSQGLGVYCWMTGVCVYGTW